MSHEFIITCDTSIDLVFLIKVGATSDVNFCLYNSGCFLEIEEL